MTTVKICKTCKHAEFPRGPGGGFMRTEPGECKHPKTATEEAREEIRQELITSLPVCIVAPATLHKVKIWRDQGDICPLWEPME